MKKNIALMALTGILTLASCGQSGSDNTAPTNVSLSASTNQVAASGGTVTLTGSASDNKGVTSVTISGGANNLTCTVSGTTAATFNCGTDTLPANTTNSPRTYTYTATAKDASGLTTSSNSVTVTVAAKADTTPTNPTTPTDATAPTVVITSPSNGADAKQGTPIKVTFNSTNVTSATCSIGDAKVDATVSSTGGYCTVTPTTAGSNVITVTGYNSDKSKNATTSVAVNAATNAIGAGSALTPDASQELTLTNEGIVKDADNGWRYWGQGISTATNPEGNTDLYVKGTVNFTATGTPGQLLEVILARTTGTDVPTAAQIQAGDILLSRTSATGTETFAFDSTRLGQMEAVREWLVVRKNGVAVSFQPLIADNKGPQQADPEFNGVNNSHSAVKKLYNGTSMNWARGDISVFTSNPSLQDREFGQAPVGSAFAQRRPIGFESVRYYFVPDSAFNNAALSDSDEKVRAKAIKASAAAKTAPVREPGQQNEAFKQLVSSNTIDGATKLAGLQDGVTYRIYAIDRDNLGNETGSATYEVIRFDNVGPTINKSVIVDDSPLPFASSDPAHCISDMAKVDLSSFADNAGGIGVLGDAKFNLGGVALTQGEFDTNQVADGKYTIDYSKITDALGNPGVGPANDVVTIDNTDPTAKITRPVMAGSVTSGDRLSVESSASDGGCGVYHTRLFWDTNIEGGIDNTTTTTIGHPVEFASKKDDSKPSAMTLNDGWDALQVPASVYGNGNTQVALRLLAVDGAGNATITSTEVSVVAKNDNLVQPALGLSDVFNNNTAAFFQSRAGGSVYASDTNTPVFPNNVFANTPYVYDATSSLKAVGTHTNNGNTEGLKSVGDYGRFNDAQWTAIRDYMLTSDPTIATVHNTGVDVNTIKNQRTANWNIRSPWVELGSSDTANAAGEFSFTSDLLNNFYWGRTFNDKNSCKYAYDQFNKIVSDTAGSYSFVGENVNCNNQ